MPVMAQPIAWKRSERPNIRSEPIAAGRGNRFGPGD